MGRIVALDQNMINMIAAGEVIERPASVVKELIENSIDAGTTQITVVIEDGGRKLMSVSDNGCGMDGEDLGRAFESHATSKIQSSSDLRAISTLGFRGEALPSIASVAQVRAVSRTKDSPSGNCIEIDCGDKGQVGPCSGDYGTTIQVRDLFYKLPARRKFLKTANTEMGHITEQFTRIALAHRGLDMTLISNQRQVYQLSGSQSLRQRIAELFSAEIAEELIETETDEKGLRIYALLGTPNIGRTNNKFQYVFLNGRFIRDRFISHAIKEAYRGSLESDRFAVVFLFIEMSAEDYDVNVHPTKIEVRFYNSNLVHSQILGTIREKLLGTDFQMRVKIPVVGYPQLGQRKGAPVRDQRVADAMAEFFKKHRPVHTQQQISFQPSGPRTAQAVVSAQRPAQYETVATSQRKIMQIHDSFIVAQTDDGFMIIDQHALHERIVYQNLRDRLQSSKLESQKLLIPESFEVTDAQADAIEKSAEIINKLGIELVPFGPRTMAVQAFPSLLSKATPIDFVQDLIDLLSDGELAVDHERLLDEVLNMAACKAAIKAGQRLSEAEMEQLLADREITECAGRCPHGRPAVIKFTTSDLEKQFNRT